MNLRSALVLLALTGAALGLYACATNTATGKTQFNLMSQSEEVKLGQEEGPKMVQAYGGEVPDPELRAYVTRIGTKLLDGVEKDYRQLPWRFTLLNSGVINAFSLPGGQVFMSRALMEKMTNEAQLAGVLGHEIGHVTAEHIDQRMGRQYGLAIGAAVAGAAGGEQYGQALSELISQGGGLFALKFDRGEESEADHLGVRYMVRAGYNPQGQIQVMEILRDAMGNASPAEWTSTHPLPQTRIKDLEGYIAKKHPRKAGDPDLVLNESQFRPFLERLKKLPPAPKSQGE